jgi:pimeloyl-ACP methyl ester carboxylesterase
LPVRRAAIVLLRIGLGLVSVLALLTVASLAFALVPDAGHLSMLDRPDAVALAVERAP